MFNKKTKNLARVRFFAVFWTTTGGFIADVNKQRRNFVSLSELEYGPLKFKFRRVRKFTFAVASLNLKVPYGTMFFLVPITLKRVQCMLMLYVFQSEMFT